MRIGEILINEKIITNPQLNKALDIQKKEPDRKLGEILVSLDYIDMNKFTEILSKNTGK